MPWEIVDAPPVATAAPPSSSLSVAPTLDPALRPIMQRESGGKPFVGYTPPGQPLVDLSKAPLDETGFPIWEGRRDPATGRMSHAAGILQIQPDTWHPIAQRLGIKDFSEESQIRVGNELKKEQGLKPWDASAWTITGGGNWKVDPSAISAEQARAGTSVVWMGPDEYKQMVQKGEEPEIRGSSRSLAKSLAAGESINDIPSLTIKNGKIVDQDGWRRAQAAEDAGVQLIPVAIHGVGDKPPEKLIDMRGQERPFDFKPVPLVPHEPTRMERFGTGVKDVGVGAAQLAAHASGLATMGEAGLTADQAQQGIQGVDTRVQQREKGIEAERAAAGQTGTDWWRVAGNVAGTVPLGLLGPEVAGGVRGAMLAGGIAGGAGAAVAPVTEGNYASNKVEQIGEGGLLGGVLGAGGNAAAQLAKPLILPAAQRLLDMGVRLLPGQLKGGARKSFEEMTTSVPFSGAAVAGAQRRAVQDFNRAMYNRVLSYIGARHGKEEPGREGIAAVEKQLSRAYEAIKPYIRFHADPIYTAEVASLKTLVAGLPDRVSFNNILSRVNTMMGREKAMDGQTFKEVESELSSLARDWHDPRNSTLQRKVGDAISSLLGSMRENLERHSPEVSGDLKKLNTAWAAFVRLREASTRRPTAGGVFTPGDLLAAEKKIAGKNVFARGDGLLQQPAEDAEKIIGSRYPDSGTAGRYATLEALAGVAEVAVNPVLVAGQIAGHLAHAAAYTSPGLALLRGLSGTGMPNIRNYAARLSRASGPVIAAPAGSNLAAPTPPPGF